MSGSRSCHSGDGVGSPQASTEPGSHRRPDHLEEVGARSPVTTTSVHPSIRWVGGEDGLGERGRVPDEEVAEQVDHLPGRVGVALGAGEGGQAGQRQGGHGVGRRGGAVEDVLGPHDEGLGVVAGGEEAAAPVVMEQVEEGVGGARRPARSTGPVR